MIKKIIAITLIFLTSITVNAQTPTRSTMKICSNGKLAINCSYFDNKSDTKSNTKPSTTTGSNTYGPNLPSTTIGSTTRQRSSIIYNSNSNFRGLGTNGKPPIKSTNSRFNSTTNQAQCPKKPVSSIVNSTINTNSNSIIKDKTTAGSPLPTNRNSNPNCPTQPTKPTVSLNVASCTKNPKLSLKCKEILEIDICKKTPSTPPTARCQTLLKPSDKVANTKANLAITTARRQFLLCTPKYIETNQAKCDSAKKTLQTANSVANSTRTNAGNNSNGTAKTNSTLASNISNRQNSNPANLSNNNPKQSGVVPQDNQSNPANTPNLGSGGNGVFSKILEMGSPLLGSITGGIFGGRNKEQAQPEPTLGSTPVDSTATQLANTPIKPKPVIKPPTNSATNSACSIATSRTTLGSNLTNIQPRNPVNTNTISNLGIANNTNTRIPTSTQRPTSQNLRNCPTNTTAKPSCVKALTTSGKTTVCFDLKLLSGKKSMTGDATWYSWEAESCGGCAARG